MGLLFPPWPHISEPRGSRPPCLGSPALSSSQQGGGEAHLHLFNHLKEFCALQGKRTSSSLGPHPSMGGSAHTTAQGLLRTHRSHPSRTPHQGAPPSRGPGEAARAVQRQSAPPEPSPGPDWLGSCAPGMLRVLPPAVLRDASCRHRDTGTCTPVAEVGWAALGHWAPGGAARACPQGHRALNFAPAALPLPPTAASATVPQPEPPACPPALLAPLAKGQSRGQAQELLRPLQGGFPGGAPGGWAPRATHAAGTVLRPVPPGGQPRGGWFTLLPPGHLPPSTASCAAAAGVTLLPGQPARGWQPPPRVGQCEKRLPLPVPPGDDHGEEGSGGQLSSQPGGPAATPSRPQPLPSSGICRCHHCVCTLWAWSQPGAGGGQEAGRLWLQPFPG